MITNYVVLISNTKNVQNPRSKPGDEHASIFRNHPMHVSKKDVNAKTIFKNILTF